MNREELEYHLDTDMENYGTRYKANLDSRWNTPEFAAIAADAVRKFQVLQSTKVSWAKTGTTCCRDMKITAETTNKYFKDFKLNLQKAALQNVPITTSISVSVCVCLCVCCVLCVVCVCVCCVCVCV